MIRRGGANVNVNVLSYSEQLYTGAVNLQMQSSSAKQMRTALFLYTSDYRRVYTGDRNYGIRTSNTALTGDKLRCISVSYFVKTDFRFLYSSAVICITSSSADARSATAQTIMLYGFIT